MGDAPLEALLAPEFTERFWSYVDRGASDGCWAWLRSKTPSGYGVTRRGYGGLSYTTMAHRAAWILENQQAIPAGMEIDHLCKSRACCNPLHLRVVTHSQNIRASRSYKAGDAPVVRVGPATLRCKRGRHALIWREYLADGSIRQTSRTYPTREAAIDALTGQPTNANEGGLRTTECTCFTLNPAS